MYEVEGKNPNQTHFSTADVLPVHNVPNKASFLSGLIDRSNDRALRSSVRLSIVVSLALNGKLTFTELLALTRVGKDSLSNHLECLESSLFLGFLLHSSIIFA